MLWLFKEELLFCSPALLLSHFLALFLLLLTCLLSLSLPSSLLQSGLREILHSSFDKCQIDSMSSFKLNCLGEAKFVEENNNLDDKCQDTPDGSTGGTLIRLPAHVPGGLSVSPSPILTCSRLTQMETLKYKCSFRKLRRKNLDSDSRKNLDSASLQLPPPYICLLLLMLRRTLWAHIWRSLNCEPC